MDSRSPSEESLNSRLKAVLFHRRDEIDSRAARELIAGVGLRDEIDFEDVSKGSILFERKGGTATPALWDGETLHEGLAAVVLAITPERATLLKETEGATGWAPTSYSYGEELDWDAPWAPMTYSTELPFWLMVPDCTLLVEMTGHEFEVEVRDDYWELYVGDQTSSRTDAIYLGRRTYDGIRTDLMKAILERRLPHMWRRCRTVLRIRSRCNASVVELLSDRSDQGARRRRVATEYIRSMCEVHLPIVNQLIQAYRLATYDYFPFEVSPWDVPVWYCVTNEGFEPVVLLPYATWDERPRDSDTHEKYVLATPERLQAALRTAFDPAELELVDALNRMERGDYSGAIRRVTTAAEAELSNGLGRELLKSRPAADVDAALKASQNDFPGRLRQYEKLRGEKLPTALRPDLDTTRDLRHDIVHRGRRIRFDERGDAQRSVDTGRWIFNWLQNDTDRRELREKKLGYRSLGRRIGGFGGHIDSSGAVVDRPT